MLPLLRHAAAAASPLRAAVSAATPV
jgi:hypothetical protein